MRSTEGHSTSNIGDDRQTEAAPNPEDDGCEVQQAKRRIERGARLKREPLTHDQRRTVDPALVVFSSSTKR